MIREALHYASPVLLLYIISDGLLSCGARLKPFLAPVYYVLLVTAELILCKRADGAVGFLFVLTRLDDRLTSVSGIL